ncbi:hypothetical protein FZ934_02980 [Rhizobium grahamii]|uniref:Uncharacterized protein n=2 Tax=Rhizobium/Agrobacterium group TaxID=227290 RepID=A0A5Q0C615_9HYPH|nr:hypothetical protein FZ934_02980 [Rhizobium grahamii]QRM47987.1 hypothetical protein F3Y33_00900 [Rhizobium sp. BG6]
MNVESFMPELYGLWPQTRAYCSGVAVLADRADVQAAVEEYFLETKSGASAAPEDLRVLLNEMTAEMREQFAAFRELRRSAEASASASGEEAAAKLARADLKAATDAMSLIVRTLEKIDQLQRQFARDRELAIEENETAMGLDDAKTRFLKRIEERATARARQLFEDWQRNGPPATDEDEAARASREAEPG